jgi:hypothetical protein
MALNTTLFKRWVSGETFTANAYVYERDLIIAEVNRIANILEEGNFEFNSVTTNTLVVNEIQITRNGNLTYTGATEPEGNVLSGDLWFQE